jgi:hypothetical protein
MRKRKVARNAALSPRRLDKLIDEATVDCHDAMEQAGGFLAMIEENLALPFATRVLGVEASVIAIEMDDDGGLDAVCEGKRQRIDLGKLPLPSPPPSGAEWIAAYRRWALGRRDDEEDEEE